MRNAKSGREYDESDIRVRPARTTKRRSKDRPDYSSLPKAFIIQVDRGRVLAITESGETVTAMKARELGKNSVVVGDEVLLDGDVSGKEGSLARIVHVKDRKNSLTRTIDDIGAKERAIVANVDLMIIVVATTNPTPRTGLIDRALVIAFDQGITPILLITKCDLASSKELKELYAPLNLEIFETELGKINSDIRSRLNGNRSVLIGHSGVGKSTFLNAIMGSELRAIGGVNDVTGRGRHTSSSAIAFALDKNEGSINNNASRTPDSFHDKSWLIDTPGVRSFGLRHIDPSRVVGAFEEFSEIIAKCQKNCSHSESTCQLNQWVISNPESATRIASLRRLLASDAAPIIS